MRMALHKRAQVFAVVYSTVCVCLWLWPKICVSKAVQHDQSQKQNLTNPLPISPACIIYLFFPYSNQVQMNFLNYPFDGKERSKKRVHWYEQTIVSIDIKCNRVSLSHGTLCWSLWSYYTMKMDSSRIAIWIDCSYSTCSPTWIPFSRLTATRGDELMVNFYSEGITFVRKSNKKFLFWNRQNQNQISILLIQFRC